LLLLLLLLLLCYTLRLFIRVNQKGPKDYQIKTYKTKTKIRIKGQTAGSQIDMGNEVRCIKAKNELYDMYLLKKQITHSRGR